MIELSPLFVGSPPVLTVERAGKLDFESGVAHVGRVNAVEVISVKDPALTRRLDKVSRDFVRIVSDAVIHKGLVHAGGRLLQTCMLVQRH
jgi:hypothetical protein